MALERLDGGLDIFIGGGADDLMRGGGVMRTFADHYARETGRPVVYFPNGRVSRVVQVIRRASPVGGPINIVGHSWGGLDAFNAAVRAARAGLRVEALVTLDPVRGPRGVVLPGERAARWLHVETRPGRANLSDRITSIPLVSAKATRIPTQAADRCVVLSVNHEDVAAMMRGSGALALLDETWRAAGLPS